NGGNKVTEFFEKLIASHFPLWQVITMAVAGLLAIIFMIKAIQYGNRAKKSKSLAKKMGATAYAAFLPIFSNEKVALGLSNQIWSIMAFALVGVALLMFVIALVMRSNWKKAEAAKEQAILTGGVQAQNANQMTAENGANLIADLKRELTETLKASSGAQAAQGSDYSLIEEMRREMAAQRREEEERRRQDEERHRQEMAALREEQAKRDEAMKMMLANMMGRNTGDDGFAYATLDDTDMLVQRVIAGLLPAVQQMMPEPTAYLAAPQEQNEELLHIVEEQNAQMQAMSEQMSELQSQLASMHEMADAVIMPDNNNEEILSKMNEMQQQIANLGNQPVTVVAADNSEDMKAVTDEVSALRAQVAKLSESQYDMAVLDDDDDDFDFDDEEEWDSILDEEDDDSFAESVIIEADGTVRKVSPNFRMRLKESSDKNREWYAAIKNLFCSQKGVTYRVCKRVEKIRYQGNVIAVIGIAKRSIKLWLALKPFEYDARRYHHKDVSDKPRFVDVPLYIRVGSDRALTRAEELILALFQEQAMEARKRYNDRDIQELIFTLKYNKLLTKKGFKQLLCQSVHVHDCDILSNEVAEKCIETKNVDYIDDSVIETVKLDDIDAKFQDGNRVTLDRLRKLGLVSEDCTGYVVAADKRLTKPLIIVANDFTM
ncbi:MAG: hypothetical protein K2N18_05605, partial [Clostridia bacterium]|nr:hypothetical protein [Clostridia bacterium]